MLDERKGEGSEVGDEGRREGGGDSSGDKVAGQKLNVCGLLHSAASRSQNITLYLLRWSC